MRIEMVRMLIEPAREILVPIATASSEDSDKPLHAHSLATAFNSGMHEVWKYESGENSSKI